MSLFRFMNQRIPKARNVCRAPITGNQSISARLSEFMKILFSYLKTDSKVLNKSLKQDNKKYQFRRLLSTCKIIYYIHA